MNLSLIGSEKRHVTMKLANKFRAAVLSVAISTYASAHAQEVDWAGIASADSVVIGTLSELPQFPEDSTYIQIEIMDATTLKGVKVDEVDIRYFTHEAAYNISQNQLTALQNTAVIALYINFDGDNYLPNIGDAALLPATEENILAVQSEISAQKAIIQNWQPNSKVPHFETVKKLIDDLTDIDRQFDAGLALERLGAEAVPAIIIHMDNRAALGRESISLKNMSSNAFEGVRHYGPKLVVDALAAILNQITGENFGSIYNGGSEAQRAHTVNGWRIYTMRSPLYSGKRPSTGK